MITVSELYEKLGCLSCFNSGDESMNRPVTGGYCGDLLSWVMGRAEPEQVWVTIMGNVNTAAVALLADVSCVILAEGVKPDDALLKRAEMEELPLFGSELSSYDLCWRIHGILSQEVSEQ